MADSIIVYTYVVGDLFHVGHLRSLQQAKAFGDYLIVGVLTDEATVAYKRMPIIPFEERMELVANIKCVDKVIRQDSLDPTNNIRKIKPNIVTHSHGRDEKFPGADVNTLMKQLKGRAIRTNYCLGISTTKIIKIIMTREVKDIIKMCEDYVQPGNVDKKNGKFN